MNKSEFKPEISSTRARSADKDGRLTRIVVKAASRNRAPKSPWANALTRRPVIQLARGKGALYGLTLAPAGWRRVIVKARIARHGTSDLGAARAQLHYIQRDGVTRAGGPGQLYDREHDEADSGAFLERQKGDTYQFRFIVAPEDGARMRDLKPFVRDLMAKIEDDLHTKLDWVAADHFNTGHPHTHIVIAGHDDLGKDLVMARHYISHGIRHRARDLVTRELGPEQPFERAVKLASQIQAERFTSLDLGIVQEANNNVLVVPADPDADRQRQALRVARLRHLEKMGLAKEPQTGVWHIDNDLQTKLRRLGEQGDIMVTMHQVLREHGPDRPAGDFAIFSGGKAGAPVIARVVEVGIADEMTDRKFIVVDAADGRLHYAELGKASAHEAPDPGLIVALKSIGGRSSARAARVEILSLWPVERLPDTELPTWLDKAIVENKRPSMAERRFGAELSAAFQARADWLIAQGHAYRDPAGRVTPKANTLDTLNERGWAALDRRLERELDQVYRPMSEGMQITGRHTRDVTFPSGRIAVIQDRTGFTLVPWRPDLAQMRGKEIDVAMRDRAITLAISRGLDRGLSR